MEEKSIPLPGSQAENIPLPAAPANALGKQLAEELCFSVWLYFQEEWRDFVPARGHVAHTVSIILVHV